MHIEQIEHIYKHSLAGVFGQAVVSAAIIYILFNQVSSENLLIWGMFKFIFLAARAISVYVYAPFFKTNKNVIKIKNWFSFYQFIMFLSGVLWATSIYFVDQYQSSNLLFFFLAVFVALSGAAIATLGPIFSIYLVFTIPMLTASSIALIMSPEPAHFETGLLTIVGFSYLIYAAFKNSENINSLLERSFELERSQKDIINHLGMAGEYRDNDTGQHVKRMSHNCYLLAIKIGMPDKKAEQLFMSSALHDIGKIGISDSILLKPGKLNADEWKVMKTHTSIGEHILSNQTAPVMKLASKIAAEHHERWDGKGYPKGISGKNIPIESRIVSICDTFDALISDRPYKEAWSTTNALDYINKESGKHFDPDLVSSFMEISDDIIEYANKHKT